MPIPVGVNGDIANALFAELNCNVKVAGPGGCASGVAAKNPHATDSRMLAGPDLNDLRVVSDGFHYPND